VADRRQFLRVGAATAGAVTIPALAGTPATASPATASPATASKATSRGRRPRPLVIGHRGASGYRPEHTLASYELAARLGADFIEPDLVSTRDGVLVARHENEISGTTDVSTRPEFASRRQTKTIDGNPVTGWFTEDFTLAELKTLRAVERLPAVRQRNTIYNGLLEVPTLQEVLDLRVRLSRELGREIGVYPETKHPTYFRSIGLPFEPPLVRILRKNGLDKATAPVFVQSFEAANLRDLHHRYGLRSRLVFLTSSSGGPFGDPRSYADYLAPAGLRDLARFVDGIGPEKNQVIPRNADGSLGTPSGLVEAAHAVGLTLHPYTFRAENQFLPADYRTDTDPNAYGRAIEEQVAFLRTGIDGLFTDQPDIGVLARQLATV
jgi:glycerophosphoryl diester phosphodiesterase